MAQLIHDPKDYEKVVITQNEPNDNYGRCPICGDIHVLNENGDQCGKG